MYDLLSGMRIVEGASFVAGPMGGLYMAQMGAEVIRFDAIGGGLDFGRWPLTKNGSSLYWEGLNKGKKSIALNLSSPEGRELAVALATAPGERGGMFLTNYPVDGFLSYERLVVRRPDLICLRVMGFPDGRPGTDYTVNAAVGVPWMTGEADEPGPVNNMLAGWDLLAGAYASFMLLAAERNRRESGRGREIRVPLSDIAVTGLSNLGELGQVLLSGKDRPRSGNAVFGAFGRDFITRDGRVMVVAITARQWRALLKALTLDAQIAALERELGVDFTADEGARFIHRARLFPLFEPAFAARGKAELQQAFDASGVAWAPYQTLHEAATQDQALFADNPVLSDIAHPSGETYLAAGSAATLPGEVRGLPVRAPRIGEHTDEILASVLGLSGSAIGALHDAGTVAGPAGRASG